jgi:hypothetical protein
MHAQIIVTVRNQNPHSTGKAMTQQYNSEEVRTTIFNVGVRDEAVVCFHYTVNDANK